MVNDFSRLQSASHHITKTRIQATKFTNFIYRTVLSATNDALY